MDRTLAAQSRVSGPAFIRQADPADRVAVSDFVCGLSPRTQYLRFFACVAPPSTGLLRALCGAAGRADVLLVTDGRDGIIGHGMAADEPARGGRGGLQSSIGLVVADAWQRRGVGTALLRVLAGRAAQRGVSSLVLEVIPDNRVMLGIIGRRWPEAPAERTADAIVFRPALGPTRGHWPVPGVVHLNHVNHHGDPRASDRSAA